MEYLAILILSKTDKMEIIKNLRSLGCTGIMVTPIGLGCWQFSNQKNMAGKFWPTLEDNLIQRIVSLSIDGGINWFDTAELYGGGESEKALSKPLRQLVKNPVMYNLLDRRIESNGVMNLAKKLGITIIAYSPLAQGLITGKFHDNPELLKNIGFRRYSPQFKPEGLKKSRPVVILVKELAIKYNVTPSQVALNWLVQYNGDTVVAIPGATKEIHVNENCGAMSFRLSDEDMVRLDNVSSIFK